MSYSIETQDGIVIDNIPDNIQRDAPELKARVAAERQRRATTGPAFEAKVAAQRAKDREEYDPTKGMSWGEKALVNLGAGFDQAVTGVRQLGTDMFGSSADSQRMRKEQDEKQQINRDLASKTTGGGALQFLGEAAPAMLIPAGAVAANSGRLGLAAAGGAGGLFSGAITPLGEGDSRGKNMAFQGTVGAALPLTLGLGADAFNMAFRPQARAVRAVQEGVVDPSMNVAERKAVLARTRDAVAADVSQRAQRQAGNAVAPRATQAFADDIPLSVAARIDSADLARLERGSRTRNGANWYDFDTQRARAVAGAVEDATKEGAELNVRRGTRSTNWDKNWSAAEAAADPEKFTSQIGSLTGDLEQLAISPAASNPTVRGAIDYVRKEVDRLGDNITPAHIQQMRAQLNGKANALADGNPLKQADRASPATINLMKRLDTLLDDVTGGRFTKEVNAGYAADSRIVDAARGANEVRNKFWDINPNLTLGNIKGQVADLDTPAITEAGLSKALSAALGDNGATRLSAPSAQRLESVLDALRRQNIVQRVAKSQTGGGGSNTAGDTLSAVAARGAGDVAANAIGGPVAQAGSGLLQGVKAMTVDRSDKLLAEALQNPEEMLKLLDKAAGKRQGGALTFQESEILNALRRLRRNP